MASPVLSSQEAERAELDTVAEALARSPRLSKLLRYLGEKYFLGETDQLHEYNIATEVFGRSSATFDPAEDAIARVESHRLRKSLKRFYETEGRNHAIQLSIPSGAYIPVFTHQTADLSESSPNHHPDPPQDSPLLTMTSEVIADPDPARSVPLASPPLPKRHAWVYALLIAGLVLAVGAYRVMHLRAIRKAAPSAANAAPSAAVAHAVSVAVASAPIRLMAGYKGSPQTDSAGEVWGPDRYFREGGTWSRPATFIGRTSDPLLFEHWRTGDFFYDIPLHPGNYELHLYFSTWQRSDEAFSTFTVRINDNPVLQAFDVNADALGENIADERIFRDVSPAKDGMLHLAFTSERGAPALNALELLPGMPHKQIPIRLVTQSMSYTDHDGQVWRPDTYFLNGRLSDQRQQIAGTPDPDLFGVERYGHFTYAIPVDVRDRYTLVLHFAELYFGPQVPGGGGIGGRVFRVMCNGSTLLDNFDIYKEAGSLHALSKTFYHLKPTAQGKLNITFEPIVNNATVSGIEVLDESK